jgi:hypothetical protein
MTQVHIESISAGPFFSLNILPPPSLLPSGHHHQRPEPRHFLDLHDSLFHAGEVRKARRGRRMQKSVSAYSPFAFWPAHCLPLLAFHSFPCLSPPIGCRDYSNCDLMPIMHKIQEKLKVSFAKQSHKPSLGELVDNVRQQVMGGSRSEAVDASTPGDQIKTLELLGEGMVGQHWPLSCDLFVDLPPCMSATLCATLCTCVSSLARYTRAPGRARWWRSSP